MSTALRPVSTGHSSGVSQLATPGNAPCGRVSDAKPVPRYPRHPLAARAAATWPGLTPTDHKSAACYLGDADEDGFGWSSDETVANEIGKSEPSVRRSRHHLTSVGLMEYVVLKPGQRFPLPNPRTGRCALGKGRVVGKHGGILWRMRLEVLVPTEPGRGLPRTFEDLADEMGRVCEGGAQSQQDKRSIKERWIKTDPRRVDQNRSTLTDPLVSPSSRLNLKRSRGPAAEPASPPPLVSEDPETRDRMLRLVGGAARPPDVTVGAGRAASAAPPPETETETDRVRAARATRSPETETASPTATNVASETPSAAIAASASRNGQGPNGQNEPENKPERLERGRSGPPNESGEPATLPRRLARPTYVPAVPPPGLTPDELMTWRREQLALAFAPASRGKVV